MGSKWSCQRAGVMGSLGFKLLTSRAALWRIVVYGWSVVSGRLSRMELQLSSLDMNNAWTRVRRHFSLRQRFIWRIRRRWKKIWWSMRCDWSLTRYCREELQDHAPHLTDFAWPFISVSICSIRKISVSISTYLRSRITTVSFDSFRKLLKTFLFDKWLLYERICGSCINLRREMFIIIIIIIVIQQFLQYQSLTFKFKITRFLNDLPYVKLGSCYRRDLGVSFSTCSRSRITIMR